MPRIRFDSFVVQAPRGWNDITDEVEAENPPYTLAHTDGVGALQFSIALYTSGMVPNPSIADLKEMLEEFGSKRGFGEPVDLVNEPGPPLLAAGSFSWGDDFLRVWEVSDGGNFAFVTYTCDAKDLGPELQVCERIVRSIVFKSPPRRQR